MTYRELVRQLWCLEKRANCADRESLVYEVAALCAQREAENEPLTLEELQKMNEHPVWWWNGRSKPVCTICSFLKSDEEPFFTNYDFEEKDCTAITPYRYFKKYGYEPYRRLPVELKAQ